ncbi:MAG: bifunctional [glutamine synthetase] adenylyltransferase/[glutamine synthetase]-adenylyl-L-tyrosine phosphorylase [Rhodospirillales bacterium]|nr:bifunctional [glutamine synthetase] adenylyltransferase/[glutamine synthetase]-adenylyl-L-tyrosine phosphorylase [Rhodospirillales bacterium]MSP80346.1 bifunctional [glutamine synthetase] adenylyltransferase/[glutamine synthetase]-adenylyl-L-tyrosine phosphorylase [Rhodospirillales bacterium]
MAAPRFAQTQRYVPEPASSSLAALGLERWLEAAAASAVPGVGERARAIAADSSARRLLAGIFGNSPFLAQSSAAEPEILCDILDRGSDDVVARTLDDLRARPAPPIEEAALMRALRVAKRRVALAVAIGDISGAWPLARVTESLSDLADAALGAAAAFLLRQAASSGAFALADDADPARGSGLVILGVGKLGARELNYSSDIDLIVLYDPERIRAPAPEALQKHFVRLARNLVRMMEERTADGYVFRTDLRLRPDPGATPLALSVDAAEAYYESLGQNWERAAMIKARAVAGDLEAGAEFLKRLGPFIWRRHLDFAAIQDIHSIKRQIHAHHGGGTVAVAGHDIKLGRGGIREIEFFVQTQQLIRGGREPRLRTPATLAGLAALADLALTDRAATAEMAEAYEFLRRVEHRLQMIDDEQTQTLPADAKALRALALFLGYRDTDAFAAEMLARLGAVERHYARLFEDSPALSAGGTAAGNLVFTGVEADPGTLATLAGLGFRQPEMVHATVRGWHHGRYRAMRSTRARELLTELMPALLEALVATADADAAFLRFDAFLGRLPSGVQIFSLFHSNPQLLALLAEIMGSAPRLAEHLGRRPAILDAMVTPGFLDAPPDKAELAAELDRQLAQARYLEEAFDASRRFAHERQFQVGVQILRGLIAPAPAAAALSAIAETAIAGLLPRVEADFALAHGHFGAPALAVIALGKLGGREMTPTSDLDLIFVYDVPEGMEASDGPRPLPASQYFARLSQRFLNALTALTAEGHLYEVDMRLRPSGNKGPLAVAFDGFVRYQENEAWTWEHMALTRARPIAGPEPLRARVARAIGRVLTRPRDPARLLRDAAEMRARIAAEHPTDRLWDVKHLGGGLVDVEFVVQVLQLLHAHTHPEILVSGTAAALEKIAAAGILAPADARTLGDALALWQGLQVVLRLTLDPIQGADGAGGFPEPLKRRLALVGRVADFVALEARMRALSLAAADVFRRLIVVPAADAANT